MNVMHESAAVIGWVVMLIVALGALCVIAFAVGEQWWRFYCRVRCTVDMREAMKEWHKNHPEKSKAYDARAEKAR